MTPDERREFDELQAEHQRLRAQLDKMDDRYRDLRLRILASESACARPAPPPIPPLAEKPAAPPPMPAAAIPPPSPVPAAAPAPPPIPPWKPPLPPVEMPPEPAPASEGLEFQLGTVWLARVGIVILLTGLVFLGNFAWQNWISQLGALGKLAIIYLAGAILCGVGGWLRGRQESVRTYAQVLIAGGAATIYYATYAAHFVPLLKVIESPIAGGALLLMLGGAFLWWADYRRLQPAALLAIILSYYTSTINPSGAFSQFSSLLLTAAGVSLLIRHQWVAVSWAALAGTYVSYGFWDSVHRTTDLARWLNEPWGPGLSFLCAYWVLFTVAVFFTKSPAFTPGGRIAFLTLNNAALWYWGLERLQPRSPSGPWIFTFCLGLALLLAAVAAWRWRKAWQELDGAYLVQGVGLATIGLAMKLSGQELALVVAGESLLLLSGSGRRHGKIFEVLGGVCGFWAFLLASHDLSTNEPRGLFTGCVVGGFLVADAWWLKVRRGQWRAMPLSGAATFFVALGLRLVWMVLARQFPGFGLPAALAVAAVIFTASIYLLRLPELTLLGQLFYFGSVALWLRSQFVRNEEPWWQAWPLEACGLSLAHWWQRPRTRGDWLELVTPLHAATSGALIAVIFFVMKRHLQDDAWVLGLSAAALVTLGYGYLTRAWGIGLGGQVFAVSLAGWQLLTFGQNPVSDLVALAPALTLLATFAFLALAPPGRWGVALEKGDVRYAALCYWLIGWALLAAWIFDYVPVSWRALSFALLASGLFAAHARWRHEHIAHTGGVLAVLGYLALFANFRVAPSMAEAVAVLLPPAAFRLARRLGPQPAEEQSFADWIQPTLSVLMIAGAWLWASRAAEWSHYHRGLTVIWSAVALVVLSAGFVLRERIYRQGGLVVLAVAVGRIFTVDVWALETVFRIVSFLTLGVVLLTLGYLYNRYAERIKQWL